MAEDKETKKATLKDLIRRLHLGADPEQAKQEFNKLLGHVGATEVAEIEEELVKEGMPREEIMRLCDVHLAVFRESLEKDKASPPTGQPIDILLEEHTKILQFAHDLQANARQIQAAGDLGSVSENVGQARRLGESLKESESHYLREENALFPYLEKHGIKEPPAIMWMEHDRIRPMKKRVYELIDRHESMVFQDFASQLEQAASELVNMLSSHFYKENNILFPAALQVIAEKEWKEIRAQFDELGYPSFIRRPEAVAPGEKPGPAVSRPVTEGMITFETGSLSKDEIETVLNTMPVDVTFVDAQDTVRYFSQSKDRIFVRTKGVIGRTVQQCHPQKSVHVVNQILDDFKVGRRDVAEFWIRLNGRLILIRYFALRDKNQAYLGCLEVTQDITDLQKIQGEKRLL